MATPQSRGENLGQVDTEAHCASLLPVNNSKDYLISLKNVLKTFKEHAELLEREEIAKTLVEVYFECGPKFSAKRILASFLQGLSPEVGDRYQTELQIQLQIRIDAYLKLLTDSNVVRSLVEAINSLMENFRLGEACLKETKIPALDFLSHALQSFVDASHQKSSPVERNKTMHHCLATIKTANRLIQKCFVEASMEPSPGDTVQVMTARFLQGGLQILKQDDFLTDCRCGVGMVMVLVLKLSLGKQYIHILLHSIFKTYVSKQEAITLTPSPQISVDSGVIHNLSLTSTLCLYFGLLAMVDPADAVLPLVTEGWILTSVFLDQLMALAPRCEDTSSKVLLAKAVTLWTTRTSTILESGVCPGSLTACLRGDGHVISTVLGYVWTTWDDQLDALRQNARITFENCLRIHLLAANSDPRQDEFLCKSTLKLLDVTWNNKGKYGCLGALVGHIGSSTLLEMNPGIAAELLSQLNEQSLACYASDLYEKFFRASHAELIAKESTNHSAGLSTWLSTWVDPVIHTLCQDNKRLKLHVIEYVLPRLLKFSRESLNYMINTLSTTDGQSRGQIGALVMCIRRARALGLLNSPRTPSTGRGDNPELWYGLVSAEVLRYALTCGDEQVRLDAFALLCENLKTTEPITELELSLLRYFLPPNLNNQSPAFRQYLLAYLHKLLGRLKESGATLTRLAGRNKQTPESQKASEILETYMSFLRWLQTHLFRNLHPGSAFARRLTSLAGLVLLIEVFPHNDDKDLYQFTSQVDASHINTLMECLTDTFEENKVAAVRVLTFCFNHGCSLQTKSQRSLFSAAMELSWSTKPHDCMTGSHIFQVLLRQPDVIEVMKAYMLDLKILSAPESNQTCCCPTLTLLKMLLLSLRDQTAVARTNLIVAAANRPMYPTMHCIRHILSDVDLRNIPDSILPHWRDFMEELLEACLDLAGVVSPVVQDSSPEGNVPTEAIMGPGLNVDAVVQSEEEKKLLLETVESEKMVTLMPEYLVVCCWRSIKEVSLILGQICLQATVGDTGLISPQQVLALGSYFTTQLLESKHRGAFELAYAGFVKMCEMLWRHASVDLHSLPNKWLEEVMCDIISEDPDSRLCATRRSAGVPFYVQALVTTEPTSTGRVCFKSAMTRLLMLALTQSNRTQMNNSQVHSLNILRALFRDTRLGEDVVPYIADGLKAAILGFKSQVWAVRNSSTLLLSALMTRIFGVKRSKDENAISKKNCQTGRAFFHRYPSLYQFLLSELDEATQDIDCRERLHLHPSLYPVLMVLGRLFPSSLEGADTHLNLAAFIPFVLKCASSPVFKTRLMAARALQPLALKDQMTSLLLKLVARLPHETANDMRQSHIHGVLLQMEHLLVLVQNMNTAAREEIMVAMLPRWLDVSWLTTRSNNCIVTRKVALEICDHLLDTGQNMDEVKQNRDRLLHLVQLVLKQELLEKCQYSSHTPALSEFTSTLAHLCLKHCHEMDSQTLQTSNTNLEHNVKACGQGQGQRGEGEICQDVKSQGQSEVDSYTGLCCQENVIISLLGSDMYEVRLSVLRPLCRSLSQLSGRRGILSDGEREEEHVGMTADTVERLSRSEPVYRKLLDMALVAEWHHECLAMVYEVLYVSSSVHTITQTTDVKTFGLIVEKLKLETRVEVKAAMLEFSGVFLPTVYNLVAQSKADDVADGAAVMEDWCRVFQECSQTGQSADLQLCCASVLQQYAVLLLLDPQHLLCQLTFDMWEVAIDLLQEDDLDVKETAALVLPALDNTQAYDDLQPTLVLERLMSLLSDHHGARDFVGCVTALTRWITESREEEQSEGVRLFDKGEMNSYREDVLLVDLCGSHLVHLLSRETTHDYTLELLPILQTALQNQIKQISLLKQVDRKTLFVETGDYQHQYETVYRSATLLRCVRKLAECDPLQPLCDQLHSLIQDRFEKEHQNYRLSQLCNA